MRYCKLCKKLQKTGSGSFFSISNDDRRLRWSQICGVDFGRYDVVCMDHFASSDIINTGRSVLLLPCAVPINTSQKNFKKPSDPVNKKYEGQKKELRMKVKKADRENLFNINNNDAQPPPIQASPILQIPLFKSDSKTAATQTNTRFCATIQVSEFADEYRINCFYCCETFPLEKWKKFEKHMKKAHLDYEEAFKISKYVTDDHDYTSIEKPTSSPIEVNPIIEQTLVIEADTLITYILDSLDSMESSHNPPVADVITNTENLNNSVKSNSYSIKVPTFGIESKFNESTNQKTSKNGKKILTKGSYSIKEPTYGMETEFFSTNTFNNVPKASFLQRSSTSEKKKTLKKRTYNIGNTAKSKQKVEDTGVLYLQNSKRSTSNKTALSRCLKRSNTVETIDPIAIKEELELSDTESFPQETTEESFPQETTEESFPQETTEESFPQETTEESFPQVTTELSFEYTPHDIIDFLLDNMKNYPVLWEYDENPFNEDYYESVEELCQLINNKWSMNIDNLKMRRSVNRVFRFYCSVYPLENVENIDQFTSFYDKCAAFLPKSVNDIAYARCSHCYKCYKHDTDLKGHLLEELRHLQWPYKCVLCKECFRDSDEYEFHKRLPHYKEVFICEQCNNKRFLHRNKYNKHMLLHQLRDSGDPGKYVCNICDKVFKASGELRNHLKYHGEKKHKCHLCPKSYFTNALLRRHIMSHNNEYILMCEVCGKGFINHNNLREHMKKHTGAKVTCNICNLKLRKSSLMRHLRTVHVACEGTIESTFRKRCHNYKRILRPMQKRFKYRNRHKEKNYSCKICNIRFERYKYILEHNKEYHSDFQKLPCKICSSEFKQKITLNRHYRQKHMLHSYQIYKIVELDEDVDAVLAIREEELEKLTETLAYSLNGPSSSTDQNKHTTIIKTDPSPDEIYIEEERLHSDTIQDQIMEVDDNIATHEIKVDDDHYMNEFFTNFLK